MGNLLTLKFWFNLRPESLTTFFQGAFDIFLVALILITLTVKFLNKKKRHSIYFFLYEKLYYFTFTNFLIGLLIKFFNYELVPFFSSRFWFMLWAIEMIIWLAFIVKNFKKIPGKRKQQQKEEEYKKYIP